ncbi:hypothetical protein KKA00_00160 [bacterium]|nr:hypothetical protein [bacterium]MBU1650603.1 hypothetical protein [bacterium]MBU1881776.1 hypothetical protein [bacterium]
MPLNTTENYLRARQKTTMMNFTDSVATADRYLKGPGGLAGDGYPLPAPGKIQLISVYDGVNTLSDNTETSFDAGDRISVIAIYEAPYFQVTVRINGSNSSTYVSLIGANTTLAVSVMLRLDVY